MRVEEDPRSWSVGDLRSRFVKQRDVWISRFVYSRFSIPLVWILIRSPFTPNQVTWASGVVGLAAAALLANPWGDPRLVLLGLLWLQLSFVLDHVDGQLARAKRMGSQGGVFLDGFVMEILVHLALSAALPLSVFFATGHVAWLWLAGAFLFAKALNLAAYMHKTAISLRFPVPRDPSYRDPLGRRPLLVLFLERFWEVKKLGNAAFFLIVADVALARSGLPGWELRGIPVTLLGAFLAVGVPLLLLSTLRDAHRSSKGRFFVDVEPYK